jgi:hypothetical protein
MISDNTLKSHCNGAKLQEVQQTRNTHTTFNLENIKERGNGKRRCRQRDNIKMNFKGTRLAVMDRIHLAQR